MILIYFLLNFTEEWQSEKNQIWTRMDLPISQNISLQLQIRHVQNSHKTLKYLQFIYDNNLDISFSNF